MPVCMHCCDCKREFNFGDEIIKLGCCNRVIHKKCSLGIVVTIDGKRRCKWCDGVENNYYSYSSYKEYFQELNITSDKEILLKKDISQLEYNNKELQEQLYMKDNEIKALNERLMKNLSVSNVEPYRSEDVFLTEKIDLLEGKLNRKFDQMLDTKLEQIMEEKLGKITAELTKLIETSTDLNESKTEIENILKIDQLEEKLNQKFDRMFNTKLEQIMEHRLSKITAEVIKLIELSSKPNENKTEFENNLLQDLSLDAASTNSRELWNYSENGIIIRGVSKEITPTVEYILTLANTMELPLIAADVANVFTLQGKEKQDLSLAVIFNTWQIKMKFLIMKEKLKQNESSKLLTVHDFVSNETNQLYEYAEVLKDIGYVELFCQNNMVFARKSDSAEPLKIYSTDHVKDLLKSSL